MALPSINLTTVRREVSRTLRDPDRKSVIQIVGDLVVWLRTRESHPREYFRLALYRRSAGDARRHVAGKEWAAIVRSWRTDENARVFRDKVVFHESVSSLPGVRRPRLLGVIDGGLYTDPEGGVTVLRSREDLAGVVRRLVEAEGGRPVFMKPAEGREGRGAYRLGAEDLPEVAWESVQTQRYMVEEAVRQHAAVDALYPHSLNTARVVTCRCDGAPPDIVGAFLRVGSGGRPVDNVGGLFAPVDLDTGRVTGPLLQAIADGGRAFDRHPDTGAVARDVVVPDLAEAAEMVRDVAAAFSYPVVGWDIGFSEDGPVLVEGNDWPGFTKLQAATGGLLDNPTFLAFLRQRPIWDEVKTWSGLR